MRIVHLADLHLGFRQYGMPERQDDFLVATAYIFKRATELKADVIHLGGDIFHSLHPPASVVYFLYTQVQAAISRGIRVIGVDGNHDSVESAWLKICGVEPLDRVDAAGNTEHTTIAGADGFPVTFAGINGGRVANIRVGLDRLSKTKTRIDILSMHLPIAEMAGFDGVEVSAREIADVAQPLGVQCVLLGDIHDYKEMVIGGVRFIYSGSVEMTALNEQENKTFSIIDVTSAGIKTAVESIPTRTIIHHQLTDEQASLDAMLTFIQNATLDPRRPPLVIVTYDPAVTGLRQKAELLLRGRALARLLPLNQAQNMDIFGQIAERGAQYERKGAMRNLREIVSERFGADSPEFPLIIACIEKPDEVDHTLLHYANSKGLAIR